MDSESGPMLDLKTELDLVNTQIVSLIARIAERRDQIEQLRREGRSTRNAEGLLHFMEAILIQREHYRETLHEALKAGGERA